MQALYYLLSCLLLVTNTAMGSQIIAGDVSSGTSFSFPVFPHAYHRGDGIFFVGANAATTGTAANFTIAAAPPNAAKFVPLTTAELVTLNGVADQVNPLRGVVINNLSLLSNHAVASKQGDPTSLYIIDSINQEKPTILSVNNLVDGQVVPAPAGGIIALSTNSFPTDTGELRAGMLAYAAVQKNGGVFGGDGGGIAIAGIIDTTPPAITFSSFGTLPLTPATQAVKINSNLSSMANAVTMYMSADEQLKQLYIGLQVVGGPGATDGAQGVIALSAKIGATSFLKLVPDSAVAADNIIAATGSSAAVTIYKVGAMVTSTQLRYLVVAGGTSGTPARQVYALPQLSASGELAKKDAEPVLKFLDTYPFFITSRALVTPALAPGDLYTSADVQAQVGGGLAPVNEITELVVAGDAVFIAGTTGVDAQPGIFYSQALFDDLGRIKGFTTWRRAGGATGAVFGMALDDRSGNFWYMTGTAANNVTTVQRTLWDKAIYGFTGLVNSNFKADSGGVQGLVDFPQTTSGFAVAPNQLAVTAVTGYQQVMLAQTGQQTGGLFGPNSNFSNAFASINGSLQGFASGVTSLTMTGDDLLSLGAIVATTLVTDGTYGWFVVGGSGGVAVLAHNDGTGFLMSPGLGVGFTGLDATMRWRKIGNFTAVRKLMNFSAGSTNNFYVLTDSSFERLAVNPALFAENGTVASIVLAAAGNLVGGSNQFFSDAIVSQKLVLLATSSGLFRNGNGTDVTVAPNAAALAWVPVVLQESVGPVSRLYAITATGSESDLADATGLSGNFYVMNSYVGYHQTRLYRFTVDYTGVVDETTVQQFPDYIVEGKKTFFLNAGEYRNYMATDGAIFALSQSRYVAAPMYLELLNPVWKNKAQDLGATRYPFTGALKVVTDASAKSIGLTLRSSAIGAWQVPTDTGMFSNE